LSSILDALKKADREAAAERSKNTPWSSRRPAQMQNRSGRRRWWAGVGLLIVFLAFAGLLFLYPRGTKHPQPEATVKNDSDLQKDGNAFPESDTPRPLTAKKTPEAPRQAAADLQGLQPKPVQGSETPESDRFINQPEPKQSAQSPVKSVKESTQESSLPTGGRLADTVQEKIPETISNVETVGESPPAPKSPADGVAESEEQPPPAEEKKFKNDPRIDLQALVWAESSEERFVVINNQLIREGGTIDNIVVEKINPDDVRLAEGSDRWYEAFQIR
jgi:hypothetical protein